MSESILAQLAAEETVGDSALALFRKEESGFVAAICLKKLDLYRELLDGFWLSSSRGTCAAATIEKRTTTAPVRVKIRNPLRIIFINFSSYCVQARRSWQD